jgi:hypothetical protein
MANREQNFKNHVRLLPPFHLFVLPVLFLNALNGVRQVYVTPSLHTGWELIVDVAILMLALLSRVQALTAQDRIIRLEMRQRLGRVLPAELQAKASALTHRQLIALRFASDEELPGLCRDVLEGRLQTGKEIKLRVKNWQADWLRV